MSDFQLHALLRGILIPGAVSGLAYLLARLTPVSLRGAVRGVGLAAGVALSYILLLGLPEWPWSGSPKGVITALFIGSIWSASEVVVSRRQWFRRLVVTAVVTFICLRPLVGVAWLQPSSLQIILSVASLATIAWMMVDRGSEQMQPPAVLVSLMVMAAGSAGYMGLTGSASLAQVSGALAAGLGVTAFLSLFKSMKAQRELNAVAILALLGLWCTHAFYVEVSWQDPLWLLIPFFWFVVRDLIGWSGSTAIKDVMVTGLVSTLPTAWGLWQVYQKNSV